MNTISMRRAAIARLTAEFGQPHKTWDPPDDRHLDCRWSLPCERHARVNVAVDDSSSRREARLWIFNPSGSPKECVQFVKVTTGDELEGIVETIHALMQRSCDARS